MTFADKLIRLRKINGMSQEDLADELGVSRQAISKWEGMQSVPDLQNVLKISELFGVTTDYLLKDYVTDDGPSGTKKGEAEAKAVAGATDPGVGAEGAGVAVGPIDTGGADKCAAQEKSKAQDKDGFARSDRTLRVCAGAFLLAAPVLSIVTLSITNAMQFLALLLFNVVSIFAVVVAGILTILSLMNRKLLGHALIALLVNQAVQFAITILSSINADMIRLINLAADACALSFAIIAVTYFYAGDKIKLHRHAFIILPSVCAFISGAVNLATADWSGNSMTTFGISPHYFALFLMGVVLFREKGFAVTKKENIGVAGLCLLVCLGGLSIVYLMLAFIFPSKEPIVATYLYASGILYFAGFATLPYFAYYRAKRPADKHAAGYKGIVGHICKTVLTCYIGHWIWVSEVTDLVNGFKEGKKRNPALQTMLYVQVPFYYIFWFNKHGQEISRQEKLVGSKIGDFEKETLAMAIFTPFVAAAVLQNRINAMILAKEEAAADAKTDDFAEAV